MPKNSKKGNCLIGICPNQEICDNFDLNKGRDVNWCSDILDHVFKSIYNSVETLYAIEEIHGKISQIKLISDTVRMIKSFETLLRNKFQSK